MTIGIYNTAVLTRTVNALQFRGMFLLDTFFNMVQAEGKEEIYFDREKPELRLAPFVSPLVGGQVMDEEGFETDSFKPAYVKPKKYINPDEPLRRQMGEDLTGSLSPAQREERLLSQKLRTIRVTMDRREEVMASEVLRTGQITVSGEKYPTTVVNFQRAANLTKTLTGANRWGEAGVSPVQDLEDWVFEIQDTSGASARTVVMDKDAFGLLRADPTFKELNDTRRGSETRTESAPQVPGQGNEKALFKGMLGDLALWVYNDSYIDDAGASAKLLPPYTVILVDAANLEGTRAYGVVHDPKANFMSPRMFAKTWVDDDPAIRWILGQSAPLVVPYRVDAAMCVTVFS